MKKLIICFITIFTITQLKAQDITGTWEGAITVGNTSLTLVLSINKDGNGGYKSKFDSPDQKVYGIPCSKTSLVKDSLLVEMAAIGGSYKGLWNGNNDVAGIYQQSGKQFELKLKRITGSVKAVFVKEPVRPQTPRPPFNYVTEDVEYDNANKSLHYGATFTRPNGNGKYPAVIIISGSGTQDRNGTLFGHKLYWVLADYLTRNGIAVLRVDDRGAGKSTGGNDLKNATSADFSYDVEASLNYLKTRADVNKKQLGLIGHSEGGIIAPMVAARRKDVSFIVMWGAPEVGGAKTNTAQNVYQLKKIGMDSLAINAYASLNTQILTLFATSENKEKLAAWIGPVFEAWKKNQSEQTLKTLNAENSDAKDIAVKYNSLYSLPWWHFFIIYNPEADLSKVKCSVLAINGEKDTQVNAATNLSLIKEVLTKSGNKDFEVKALPGLNHLLQTATTGDVSEYEKIDETISPQALNIISSWIKIHVK